MAASGKQFSNLVNKLQQEFDQLNIEENELKQPQEASDSPMPQIENHFDPYKDEEAYLQFEAMWEAILKIETLNQNEQKNLSHYNIQVLVTKGELTLVQAKHLTQLYFAIFTSPLIFNKFKEWKETAQSLLSLSAAQQTNLSHFLNHLSFDKMEEIIDKERLLTFRQLCDLSPRELSRLSIEYYNFFKSCNYYGDKLSDFLKLLNGHKQTHLVMTLCKQFTNYIRLGFFKAEDIVSLDSTDAFILSRWIDWPADLRNKLRDKIASLNELIQEAKPLFIHELSGRQEMSQLERGVQNRIFS